MVFSFCYDIKGQDLYVNLQNKLPTEVQSYTEILLDPKNIYDTNNLPLSKFQPFDTSLIEHSGSRHIWFKLHLSNPGSDTIKTVLFPGIFKDILFAQKTKSGWDSLVSGWNVSKSNRPIEIPYKCTYQIMVNPFDSTLVLFRLSDWQFKKRTLKFKLYETSYFLKNVPEKLKVNLNQTLFAAFFLGAIFFVIIFSLIQYYQVEEIAYLFYVYYLTGVFLYFFFNSMWTFELYPEGRLESWLGFFMKYEGLFEVPITSLIYAAYLLFLSSFLDFKEHKPELFNAISYFFYFLVFYVILDKFIYIFLDPTYAHWALHMFKYIIVGIGIVFIYFILKARIPLTFYIIAGTISLIVFASMNNFLTHAKRFLNFEITGFWGHALFYTELGILIEIFFFSVGLAYKNRISIEYRNKLELMALKGQMDSHFIFGGLNSIRAMIKQGHSKTASNFLSKIAKLWRMMLKFSNRHATTLTEEFEFCKLYLENEKLRNEVDFTYQFKIEKNLDPENIMLPPMTFQIYVENSLNHGLVHKKGNRKLTMCAFKNNEDLIVCRIEDNGIGRARSKEINKKLFPNKKSFGMNLSKERFKYFGIKVKVIDKYDQDQNPNGTIVEIIIDKNNSLYAKSNRN